MTMFCKGVKVVQCGRLVVLCFLVGNVSRCVFEIEPAMHVDIRQFYFIITSISSGSQSVLPICPESSRSAHSPLLSSTISVGWGPKLNYS